MMYPILCKVRYESLHQVFSHRQVWIQLGFSVIVNWIVAPLFMVSHFYLHLCPSTDAMQLALAWAFLPDESGLRNGLIFVGIARCIAMVCFSCSLSSMAWLMSTIGLNLDEPCWWR